MLLNICYIPSKTHAQGFHVNRNNANLEPESQVTLIYALSTLIFNKFTNYFQLCSLRVRARCGSCVTFGSCGSGWISTSERSGNYAVCIANSISGQCHTCYTNKNTMMFISTATVTTHTFCHWLVGLQVRFKTCNEGDLELKLIIVNVVIVQKTLSINFSNAKFMKLHGLMYVTDFTQRSLKLKKKSQKDIACSLVIDNNQDDILINNILISGKNNSQIPIFESKS